MVKKRNRNGRLFGKAACERAGKAGGEDKMPERIGIHTDDRNVSLAHITINKFFKAKDVLRSKASLKIASTLADILFTR